MLGTSLPSNQGKATGDCSKYSKPQCQWHLIITILLAQVRNYIIRFIHWCASVVVYHVWESALSTKFHCFRSEVGATSGTWIEKHIKIQYWHDFANFFAERAPFKLIYNYWFSRTLGGLNLYGPQQAISNGASTFHNLLSLDTSRAYSIPPHVQTQR